MPSHHPSKPMTLLAAMVLTSVVSLGTAPAQAPTGGLVLARGSNTISLEPYAPNIIRVTLTTGTKKEENLPGPGIDAIPKQDGWTVSSGGDEYHSSRLSVRVSDSDASRPMPLDKVNRDLRIHYFGDTPDSNSHEDAITISTETGKPLLTLRRWSMALNPPDPSHPDDTGSHVSAVFDSPADEHYYGLGQHQEGFLDLRDHRVQCWHDYTAVGGESLCVPFVVSTKGYGLLWDNPSKTTVDFGFNAHTSWSSDVGDRVSFFVIAGNTSDEIYSGYRQLTGVSHMLPRAAYGYIQSKAIYPTQEQLLAVADGYRKRKLPADILVVDFLNMTRQGEMDLDLLRWPDAAAMNQKLRSMGFTTMISVWPHYARGTQFYNMLQDKGWLIRKADGTPDEGTFKSVIGPNLDTTNPEAARWYWEKIRDRYVKPDGFDYIWLDETEPDIDPLNDKFFVGSGRRFYNVYPLFHTAAVYDGFRRDFGDSHRVMSLVRAAYLGAQRNGSVFWSSDIFSTWDMLKRSIPAGLDFTASGMPYWDTDIAGFFSPSLPRDYKPAHPPLVDPSDALENVDRYTDYPELFVRWFQWGVFQPVMRAHGERNHNEVWAYGKQAEGILSKYLRLRYELLPYTYSLGFESYKNGAPFMRALFMDFPQDAKVADVRDEYMFGPAFLVAPVTDQGATQRDVYLPAGTDWYNYWTNERLHGGQTIVAKAPIDTIPLFVRAGSIIPFGSTVLSSHEKQDIQSVRVYPGKDADFNLFSDDGVTYAYEHGESSVTHLHWNDGLRKLTPQRSNSLDTPRLTSCEDHEVAGCWLHPPSLSWNGLLERTKR